jgi:hypothetical protein
VHAETSAMQPRVQAICAAVGPDGWRALTAEMVARRLLGAVDRLLVLEVIGATLGASARDLASVEPADRSDDRIEPLVHLMAGFRWRDVTLTRLVQLLLEALDQWWLRRDAFEHELACLLDEQH